MTDFEKVSAAKDLAEEIRLRLKQTLSDLDSFEHVISNYWDDDEKVAKAINKFLTASETAFLKAKNVMQFYPDGGYEEIKAVLSPWSVKYQNGEYIFILPPLASKRNSKRAAADGKNIKSIVSGLLDSLEIKDPFKKAQIEITFEVNKKAGDAAPDFDNIDLKAMIDAFQGRLIENDTALDYELIFKGIVSSESKTIVLVKGI